MRILKYLAAFSLPLSVGLSFTREGWISFLPVVYAFIAIPIVEYFIGEDPTNLDAAERELARKDNAYDILLWLTVPTQVGMLAWFLWLMKNEPADGVTTAGRIASMGLMCGVFGINVAHELGHRTTKFEQVLARIMLCTSFYMHFFIEHNRGHHRNVGTPDDGATARKGEMVYTFWLRTIVQSFLSAWQIVKKERNRKKKTEWSFGNEMIQYLLIQAALIAAIAWYGGWDVTGPFLLAALIGILLLETVNYIEHYGLVRKKVSEHRYEDVEPWHSWNSDFILGRLILFELTRHSDHHWEPSKHYQLLDSMPKALQLPAGYPAMMLLSLLPPVWFKVMDRRLV
ncbi:MAG: alkane 1-monooxygenase [Flavobacteriales bacterium]